MLTDCQYWGPVTDSLAGMVDGWVRRISMNDRSPLTVPSASYRAMQQSGNERGWFCTGNGRSFKPRSSTLGNTVQSPRTASCDVVSLLWLILFRLLWLGTAPQRSCCLQPPFLAAFFSPRLLMGPFCSAILTLSGHASLAFRSSASVHCLGKTAKTR